MIKQMDNVERYAPPEGYYENTHNRDPSAYLIEAIKLIKPSAKTALDFGCGAGSETKLLLNEEFAVIAVDGNKEAEEYIKKLPHQDRVAFVCSSFEEFDFKNYDLVNSSRSLPFIDKSVFGNVMSQLLNSINQNGVFVGEFYGVNDEWNKPGETMTFLSRSEIERLFKGMTIIKLKESEEDGHIANGKAKHWHRFYVVAQKVSNLQGA